MKDSGRLARCFIIKHAGIGISVVTRGQMDLVDGSVAAYHLGGLEGQHVSVLLTVQLRIGTFY